MPGLRRQLRPSKTRAAPPELVAQGGSSPKGRTRAPGNVLLPRRCYTLAAVGHPACRGPGLPRRRPRPRQRARTVNVRVLYDRPHQTTARGRFARNAAERHTRFGRRARRLDGVRRGRPRVRWGGSPSHPSKNASWRFAQPSMTESPYRTSWPSRTQRNPSSGATPLRKRLTAHGRPGGSPLVSLRPLENASWRFAQPSMTESPYRTSWPSRTQRNPSSGATPVRKTPTAHGGCPPPLSGVRTGFRLTANASAARRSRLAARAPRPPRPRHARPHLLGAPLPLRHRRCKSRWFV